MAPLTNDQLSALARLGAQARIAELIAEIDAILAAFPDLGSMPARPGGDGPGPFKPAAAKPTRKRYRMSAANRKAAAERMKAYWAAKRQAATRQSRKAK